MFGVQFITHHTDTITYLDSVRIALEGGCRWIQLRMKEAPDTQAEEVARQALALCRAAGAVFIIEDVRIHYEGGADYIGCGPFRYTTTKQKLAPILGLEGYRAITARMREEGIDLPVVGIGGVTAEDMSALAGAGLSGIALSGSVLRAADPVGEMRRVMQIAKQVSDNYGRQNQN